MCPKMFVLFILPRPLMQFNRLLSMYSSVIFAELLFSGVWLTSLCNCDIWWRNLHQQNENNYKKHFLHTKTFWFKLLFVLYVEN